MWLSERRHFLAGLGVLALGGCFRPMLAEDSTAQGLRGQIALPRIDGRFGYYLVHSLEDRLGAPADPDYRLEVSTELEGRGLAISPDSAVTRINLVAKADWSLWRNGAKAPLMTDSVVSQSGYSATASLFATRVTRRDIERRLARDLGQRIARAIMARSDDFQK